MSRMKLMQIFFPALALAIACSTRSLAADLVRVYPAPPNEPLSNRFAVTVNGQNSPVYVAKTLAIAAWQPEVQQEGEAGFTSFDMSGPVSVSVTVTGGARSAKVLPTSRGIRPVVSGNTVTFSVGAPGPLTVEVNGDWNASLHIFANPPETDLPRADDPNVIYFGPGIHEIAPLKVGSGKTVYVAGGAFVYGKLGPNDSGGPVISLEGSNIVLRGRGTIDGSLLPRPTPKGNILVAQGRNIQVEGVVLRDSSTWTFPVRESQQVKIKNIKILGWRGSSDGIDITNSQDVEVSDSFVRTFDDLIVIKTNKKGAPASKNITVKHSVLWNEKAHALSIGAELQESVENVDFSDCDIIHDKGRDWLLRVLDADSGAVRHIVFENLRVEEARRLMSLWIGHAVWSKEDERGHIEDVTFRNIHFPAPERGDRTTEFKGYDAQHEVRVVRFENVTIGGRILRDSDIGRNEFVQGITIVP